MKILKLNTPVALLLQNDPEGRDVVLVSGKVTGSDGLGFDVEASNGLLYRFNRQGTCVQRNGVTVFTDFDKAHEERDRLLLCSGLQTMLEDIPLPTLRAVHKLILEDSTALVDPERFHRECENDRVEAACKRALAGMELWEADPECVHNIVHASGGGVKCTKCSGWTCR